MISPESSPMSEFKLSDAIAHLNNLGSAANQIWAFYTATVLGSLALGASHQMTPLSSMIFLLGFWAFAVGEATLLQKYTVLSAKVRSSITTRLQELADPSLEAYRECLSASALKWKRPWLPLAVQMVGDVSVTLMMIANAYLWFKPA